MPFAVFKPTGVGAFDIWAKVTTLCPNLVILILYATFQSAPDEEEAKPSDVGIMIVQHAKDLVTCQL